MTQKKNTLTAVKLRILLALLLVVQLAIGVGIFLYGHGQLVTFAGEVSNKRADAEASSDSLSSLQNLQTQLHQYDDLTPLLQNLKAEDDLPQFRAVADLQNITRRYGIGIDNIAFADDAPDAAGGATPEAGGEQPATPAASGSRHVSITFDITGSISYTTFLNFLNAIENNTPKLQINSISLPDGSTRNSIEPGQLTLKLFIK